MSSPLYDKIIVGAGVAGLASAYEVMAAAKAAGRSMKLVVLTDKINSPSAAGTHLLSGLDGFELDQIVPNTDEVCDLVRIGLDRIGEIVSRHRIDCRYDLFYQLIAPTPSQNAEVAAFHSARHGYRAGTFHELSDLSLRVRLDGYNYSLATTTIGQINGVEFLHGLTRAIREMGAEVIEGARYEGHTRSASSVVVKTAIGDFTTLTPPLMAGGPHLMSRMPGLPVPITPIYTMAAHVELTPDDAKRICTRPTAFFSSTKSYLWGSLDEKNVLTFGHGICESPDGRQLLETNLRATFRRILPELSGAYESELAFSFDAMACTANQLPIVGRLKDYDVMTGNCGRGFAQSFGEARAFASWIVNGDDRHLCLFESLNSPPVGG